MEKLVIIGSGAAGLTAAIYAARAELSPIVLDGSQPGGQLTTTSEVENFPGFPDGIDGTILMMQMRRQAEKFGARIKTESVDSVDFSQSPYKITLASGEGIQSRSIIIATGAEAQYLGLESEKKFRGSGISGCATCDGAFFRNVDVAVVGGGDVACEDAIFLTNFACKVYLIHRRDELRASVVMAERAINHEKIEMCWNSVVEEFLGDESGLTGIRLKNTQTDETREIEVQGAFIAIGHKPNTEAFKGHIDLDQKGYVKSDGVKTAIPGVFVAGDVADSKYRQAVTAAGSGCAAALEAERFLSENHRD